MLKEGAVYVELRGQHLGLEMNQQGDVFELRHIFGEEYYRGLDRVQAVYIRTVSGNIYELAVPRESVAINLDSTTMIDMHRSARDGRLAVSFLEPYLLRNRDLKVGLPFYYFKMLQRDYRLPSDQADVASTRTSELAEIVSRFGRYSPEILREKVVRDNAIIDDFLKGLPKPI